jgi:hypothetical protein
LINLREGHEEVAKKLQVKAKVLSALPREMRDAIFEQLYIREEPIEVEWSRIGDNIIFKMPKDEALYLSAWHVGAQIAGEAAEIFYKHNLFAFNALDADPPHWTLSRNDREMTQEKFEQWFDTDHFGSGIKPRGLVRKIDLYFREASHYYNVWCSSTLPSHRGFETEYDKQHQMDAKFDHRAQLEYLSTIEGLQEIRISCPIDGDNSDILCRLISPVVRQLKVNRVKVVIRRRSYSEYNAIEHGSDFSSYFDEPSAEDYVAFEKVTGRGKFHNPNEYEDVLLAWWDLVKESRGCGVYNIPDVNPGFVRVWLTEHIEVYNFHQKNRNLLGELDGLKADVEWQESRAKAVRLRYYVRVTELVNPELATSAARTAVGNPWG